MRQKLKDEKSVNPKSWLIFKLKTVIIDVTHPITTDGESPNSKKIAQAFGNEYVFILITIKLIKAYIYSV